MSDRLWARKLSQYVTSQLGRLSLLPSVPLGAVLHSSNEPGELSLWLCHDDSTINIVLELLLLWTKAVVIFISVK